MKENKRGEAFLSCTKNHEPRYDTTPGMIKKASGSRIKNFSESFSRFDKRLLGCLEG